MTAAASVTATASQTTAAIANRSQIPIEKTRALQVTDNLTLYCISNSEQDVLKDFDALMRAGEVTGAKPTFEALQLDMFVRPPYDPNASEMERDWKEAATKLHNDVLPMIPKALCVMMAQYLFQPLRIDLAAHCPFLERRLQDKLQDFGAPVPEHFEPVPIIRVKSMLPPPLYTDVPGVSFFYTQSDNNCSYLVFSARNQTDASVSYYRKWMPRTTPECGISLPEIYEENILLVPVIKHAPKVDRMILIIAVWEFMERNSYPGLRSSQSTMMNKDRMAVHQTHRLHVQTGEVSIMSRMQHVVSGRTEEQDGKNAEYARTAAQSTKLR